MLLRRSLLPSAQDRVDDYCRRCRRKTSHALVSSTGTEVRCCEIGFTVGDRVWLCGYQHGYQDYQFEKIPRPPGEIELTRFRAQLFEPAEARNIHEDFYAKTVDPDNKDVWIQSTFRGELVGLLRARWGDKPKKGIVYEVSVRPDHRGHGTSWQLHRCLEQATQTHRKDWLGNPERVSKSLDRELELPRTVYGISLFLGFETR